MRAAPEGGCRAPTGGVKTPKRACPIAIVRFRAAVAIFQNRNTDPFMRGADGTHHIDPEC